ncbi:2-hydroxy-3-keto-5-methylthiopentenyl-1-phosphate phosphatase [Bacillus cereus]|jgi:2-hydroxy-3-keto-5-methylthiopentenyl-1-phosphate phosphatase|uniref:2-hydroxy-3-keto-5-methylthiopentenyl-1- phosphate phosphatase n=1 Tax=Bacillus cereus group TaxID=86661 RepID=UPI000BF7AF8B|nr:MULTISPECIES: 2-hydroxy-3-keto-5-methylthiopentenyl-1-phosphate phosphatase [Bacillus cereus group]MDA1773960.1 2-hydroxy-3-keto-5-methylthiopentenyl-1-phosphate phosphatase [Bacillus cereus]MDM8361172.1 2-hydroxy-3-keto-5-methylthiopentenyl-1-phosphate phosphatase [Bacillus thuringiensis]PFX73963.1 2-hydroxy-3-keto-5-methylthiopentenyl-1-phosphate phosphatase [Bacillus cereus]HDR6268016.1 2-hydroxy-3-keto-5-methylthiopentenyl-1-phosphate phosphatase [Bacillus cereus]
MSIQVFCDFDGTITNNDNIMSIMEKFAPPEAAEVKNRILSQELSIQEGVSQLFQLIPTHLRDNIIQFLKETAEIRSGFHEFIQFVKENNISFYVISGGMDFFVYPLLQGIIPKEQIYCNETDFSKEFITVKWPHSCDDHCQNYCGLCKSSLIRKLSDTNDFHIVIGDSITDLQAAKQADKVFARDFLITKCEENHIAYTPFETFQDVQAELKLLLEVRA